MNNLPIWNNDLQLFQMKLFHLYQSLENTKGSVHSRLVTLRSVLVALSFIQLDCLSPLTVIFSNVAVVCRISLSPCQRIDNWHFTMYPIVSHRFFPKLIVWRRCKPSEHYST